MAPAAPVCILFALPVIHVRPAVTLRRGKYHHCHLANSALAEVQRPRPVLLPLSFELEADPTMIGSASSTVLMLAWKNYLGELQRRPLRTKSMTSALIAGLSDIIAQRIIKGGWAYDHNWKRTLALALYGFLWNGPSAHYWQKFMELVFQGKSDIVTVLKKVLIDQTTYGPVCNIIFLSFATVVLEGKSLQMLNTKVRRDYPLVQWNGWKVWPLAALINYKFVPLQFRVLFINCVALCWSIFLLLRARKLTAVQAKAAAAPASHTISQVVDDKHPKAEVKGVIEQKVE